MTQHLFAILIGGSHPKANIELHDLRFCVGETLQDTYAQLKASWWGTPASLHIDAYIQLDYVDGYRVSVETSDTPQTHENRLWFINCGYYENGVLAEGHAYRFMVGDTKPAVWRRALNSVRSEFHSKHKDNFVDVDEVLDVTASLFESGHHIRLTRDPSHDALSPKIVTEYIPFV